MKVRIVYLLAVTTGLGAMCAAGQNSPSGPHATDTPGTTAVAAAPDTPTLPPNGEDLRKRVVVDAFDYSTVLPSVQMVFNPYAGNPKSKQPAPPAPNIGAGIQAMLMQRLAQAGKIVIVDKGKLDEIKKMQTEGISNRNQPGKGARLGRIRTADLLLAGDIVVFGRDDKGNSGIGTFVPWPYSTIGGLNKKEDKAVVKVTYRLLDAETGEVVKSGDAEGQSIRKSKGIGGIAAYGGMVIDMGSANFAQTIIGEATVECVKNLVETLGGQLATIKYKAREVEGMVAAASGNTVTLNVGSSDGVNIGDLFDISRLGGDVKDPVTGEVIDRNLEKKGEMTVITVRERVAIGAYTGTPAEPKDIATRKTAAGEQK
jgi:curli biogenesis system outer membrane secretion channel CsgG